MDDAQLIGFALNLLDPVGRAAVAAHVAAHPADAAKVDRLRRALRPLEADRDGYDPPPGLATAAVARTAEYGLAHGLFPDLTAAADEPDAAPADEPVAVPSGAPLRAWPADPDPVFPGWSGRANAFVAAGIAVVAVGLAVAAVGKVRQANQVTACQNNLRDLHRALVGYSETHNGRLPQVGTPGVPTAGAFASALTEAGLYPPPVCPAAPAAEPVVGGVPVGYAYTLGYTDREGRLVGMRRADGPDAATDWSPVAADLPPADGLPVHARGQNVLYLGGAVRFSTTALAGVDGDDIYHNDAGLVGAGLRRDDASLGRPTAVP